MKTNLISAADLKKGAKVEITNVNTNPTYLFRKLNKIASGKDQDAKEVEGFSREHLKELAKRLTEAFNCGGFWWGSVIARNGYIVTAAREVVFAEGDENNEDVKPLYCGKGDLLLTEVINGKLYTLKAASVWSFNAVIQSASLWLKLAEAKATASGELYTWQKAQAEAKKKASEEKKEAAKKERKAKSEAKKEAAKRTKKLTEEIAALKESVTNGTLSAEAAAAKVVELMAA